MYFDQLKGLQLNYLYNNYIYKSSTKNTDKLKSLQKAFDLSV